VNDIAVPGDQTLDDEQFRRLVGYGEVEHVEAGRELYTSGDCSYDFFLLRTATVDLVRKHIGWHRRCSVLCGRDVARSSARRPPIPVLESAWRRRLDGDWMICVRVPPRRASSSMFRPQHRRSVFEQAN
jgi:hypothetical protein